MRGKAAEPPLSWQRGKVTEVVFTGSGGGVEFGPPELFPEIEQRSEDWYELRRGIPTASEFGCLMAAGGVGRETYLYRLAGELYTGELAEQYRSAEMNRGIEMEPEARDWYGRTRLATLARIGFARRRLPSGRFVGCSPDSLVDQDGLLEVKTSRPDLLIQLIRAGRFPSEHRAQCQGELWITGRAWCDLLLYYHGRRNPLAVVFRIERDERFIKQLSDAVECFDFDLDRAVKDLKTMQERS